MLEIGKKAPDFSLEGLDNKKHALKDFKSKYLIIYFYPRDLTPGCTIEANEFNKNLEAIRKMNADVIGISNDDIKSHEKFVSKCDLKFMLLSDTDSKTIKDYDSYGDRGIFGIGTLRNTYILKNGVVVKAFEKVNPKAHVSEIISALKELE